MKKFLDISNHELNKLIDSVQNTRRVSDPVHNMYQYPASFSPYFAETIIKHFSNLGDYVLDPFMGGGTSVIEAIRNGRNIIGNDINSLSYFLSKTKSQKLSNSDVTNLKTWFENITNNTKLSDIKHVNKINIPKHMSKASTKRYMEYIEFYIKRSKKLNNKKQRDFSLIVLLRVSKRVLDAHRKPLGIDKFRTLLTKYFNQALSASSDYSKSLVSLKKSRKKLKSLSVNLYNDNAESLCKNLKILRKKPKLIITSPPYPGVNINYNRWQIYGKLDTDLPYYIINKKDNMHTPSYHFGSNSYSEGLTKKYMKNALEVYRSLYKVLHDDGYLIQMVGFANINSQLEFFLNVLALAGFSELKIKKLNGKGDGRIWRQVPGRKWHAALKGTLQSSNEVLLIHKKVKNY